MDNSLASFAGQAFASSPVKPDAEVSVSGVSLTIGGPDYSVENLHNVPTQSITLALGQVSLEMIALPSGLNVPAVLGNETVNADSNLVQTGVSVTTTLQQHELGVLTAFPSGVTANTTLGNVAARTDKTHEVTGVSVSTALGQVVAETATTLGSFPLTMTLGQETLFLNANVALTGLSTTMSLGQVVGESRAFATQLSATTAVGQVAVETAIELPSISLTTALGSIAVFTWTDVDDTTNSGDTWTDVPGAPANSWTPVDETTGSGGSWTPV